jgi:hypothetical protein
LRPIWNRQFVLAVAGLLTATSGALAAASSAVPAAAVSGYQVVPRAHCGSGSNPETGFQGEVPLTDRAAGFMGFSCNLKRIGQFQRRGRSPGMESAPTTTPLTTRATDPPLQDGRSTSEASCSTCRARAIRGSRSI